MRIKRKMRRGTQYRLGATTGCKVAQGGAYMGLLGADSGLVTIKGLLWDCDVSPRTERGREQTKGGEGREGGGGIEGNHRGIDKEDQQ